MEIMNSSWKDRLKVNYTFNTIGSGKDLISFIETLLAEERKKERCKVIDYISEKEGWEETGDKYRKYFGLRQKYGIKE